MTNFCLEGIECVGFNIRDSVNWSRLVLTFYLSCYTVVLQTQLSSLVKIEIWVLKQVPQYIYSRSSEDRGWANSESSVHISYTSDKCFQHDILIIRKMLTVVFQYIYGNRYIHNYWNWKCLRWSPMVSFCGNDKPLYTITRQNSLNM
jgi:hypothetical protein